MSFPKCANQTQLIITIWKYDTNVRNLIMFCWETNNHFVPVWKILLWHHNIFKITSWLKLNPKYELNWSNGYMPLSDTFVLLSLLKIICDSMSYDALHFSGQQNSPSFRQFSVSAPQHLPQLCTTQQKPREVESWASAAHHAVLCTPVMTQYLEGWKCRHCAGMHT